LKSRSQRLPRDVKSATFIAQHVTPSTGSRGPAYRISSEGDRTGTSDHNDSRRRGVGSYQCDLCIVRNLVPLAPDELAGVTIFILCASAESQTRCGKNNRLEIEAGTPARFRKTCSNGTEKPGTSLGRADMIARTATPSADDSSRLVGD